MASNAMGRGGDRTNSARHPSFKNSISVRASEADLEARVSAELSRLFPSLTPVNLSHQLVFNVRLGRRVVAIDGRGSAKGRLDILVSFNGGPLAVLELKAPGRKLLPQDVRQGLSYARLLEPMAPFVVVTNGHETAWHITFDGAAWNPGTVDEAAIKQIVERGAGAAAAARSEAIQALLGSDRRLWAVAAETSNTHELAELSGELEDVTRPLAEGFSIRRAVAAEALRRAESGARAVAIVGAMLSGRTNVLAQIARAPSAKLVPLYLRGDGKRGLFRQMAAAFSEGLLTGVSAEQVATWIRSAFRSEECPRLLLLIDGLDQQPAPEVLADLEELAELAQRGRVRLVLALDDPTLKTLRFQRGRPTKTVLGTIISGTLPLRLLSDAELADADAQLGALGCRLVDGAQYSEELRTPRLLRLSAAVARPTAAECAHVEAGLAVCGIPSVFGLAMLQRAWGALVPDGDLRDDLRRLAAAVVKRRMLPSAEARLFTHGLGYLPKETAERELGEARVARLVDLGVAAVIDGPSVGAAGVGGRLAGSTNGDLYLANRVPELVAAAAVGAIVQEVRGALQAGLSGGAVCDDDPLDRAYRILTEVSQAFPLADIVAAWAVLDIASADAEDPAPDGPLSSGLVRRLLEDMPRRERVRPGTRVLVGFRDERPVHHTFEPEEAIWATSNVLPWLALSNLVGVAVIAEQDEELGLHAEVLHRLGGFEGPLLRVYPASPDMKSTLVHEMEGVGSLLCDGMGVVEPIAAAFRDSFKVVPAIVEDLAERALTEVNLPLANRLMVAARSLLNVTDAAVAERAARVERLAEATFTRYFSREAGVPTSSTSP